MDGRTIYFRLLSRKDNQWRYNDYEYIAYSNNSNYIDLTNHIDYGYNQDSNNGTVTVSDGGNSIELTGNRWRAIEGNYVITENTILELDFSSNQQGEIQGIGFTSTLGIDNQNSFQFYGSQNWEFKITMIMILHKA